MFDLIYYILPLMINLLNKIMQHNVSLTFTFMHFDNHVPYTASVCSFLETPALKLFFTEVY